MCSATKFPFHWSGNHKGLGLAPRIRPTPTNPWATESPPQRRQSAPVKINGVKEEEDFDEASMFVPQVELSVPNSSKHVPASQRDLKYICNNPGCDYKSRFRQNLDRHCRKMTHYSEYLERTSKKHMPYIVEARRRIEESGGVVGGGLEQGEMLVGVAIDDGSDDDDEEEVQVNPQVIMNEAEDELEVEEEDQQPRAKKLKGDSYSNFDMADDIHDNDAEGEET